MNNAVTALVLKRGRLVEKKRQLKDEYDRQCREIDAEIRKIDSAIETVNKAVEPYICPVCGGSGNIRRADAAGQMEDVECSACHGTGIKEIEG